MARRDVAEAAGMEILGRWVGTATKGVKPDVMGIGPAEAVPKLLERFQLKTDDIDLWELNEAFASQSLMVMDTLKLDAAKVNPKGGAIALGHPLGASGGRLVTSLLAELRRTAWSIAVTCNTRHVPELACYLVAKPAESVGARQRSIAAQHMARLVQDSEDPGLGVYQRVEARGISYDIVSVKGSGRVA
ncbi:hypothetical protein L1887_57028 [Cichorium endivia]|nr:hypothetical protein L1887_57028 [Cichorium endivia]